MITRDMLSQFRHLLRPVETKVVNLVARGVVELVDQAKKLQILQVTVQEDEPIDDVEHFQPYGFKSVPLAGAETILVFPGAYRGHPVGVVTDDRRTRPTDWDEGDAGIYNTSGAMVRLKGADVEVTPGTGGVVYVRSAGGVAEELVTKSDFLNHTHATAATGTPSLPIPLAAPFVYTTKLKAE